MKLWIVSLLVAGLGLSEAMASPSPDGFYKHFAVQKTADGHVQQISIKDPLAGLSVQLIVDELMRDVKAVKGLHQRQQLGLMVDEITNDTDSEGWPDSFKGQFNDGLKKAAEVDVDALVNDHGFLEVIKRLDDRLRGTSSDFAILAKTDDSSYFYDNHFLREAIGQITGFALSTIGSVPVAGAAIWVVERARDMIEQRRAFHQYLILEYLDTFSPEQLGLTVGDVALIRSSIYESQIDWYKFWESFHARAHWDDYGNDSLAHDRAFCDQMLAQNATDYEQNVVRLGLAHVVVTRNGEKEIVNLLNRKYFLSKKPSLSYSYTNTGRVERQRRLIRVAELGMKIINLPFATSLATDFADTLYVKQIRTDGALFALFEMQGDAASQSVVLNQSINPLIQIDIQGMPSPGSALQVEQIDEVHLQ